MNTDYATTKKDGSGEVVLALPDSLTLQDSTRFFTASVEAGSNNASAYRFYITSTKFAYAISSSQFFVYCKQDGYDSAVQGRVYRSGKKFYIQVGFIGSGDSSYSTTYSGMGQTLTLHIQSFLDPFSS